MNNEYEKLKDDMEEADLLSRLSEAEARRQRPVDYKPHPAIAPGDLVSTLLHDTAQAALDFDHAARLLAEENGREYDTAEAENLMYNALEDVRDYMRRIHRAQRLLMPDKPPEKPAPAFPPTFTEVLEERYRQDVKWGGPEHDDTHSLAWWFARVNDRCFVDDPGIMVSTGDRRRLVEIAALAIAAIEVIDRKEAQNANSND